MPIDTAILVKYGFAGNNLYQWLTAIIIFVVTYTVLKIFKKVVVARLKKIAKKTKTDVDDLVMSILDSIGWLFYVIVPLWVALKSLTLPAVITTAVDYVAIIVVTFYAVKAVQKVIDHGAKHIIKARAKQHKDLDTSAVDLLTKIAKGVLWLLAVILILSNLGYDITTLIAGLGVGGIAIAFALQNVLSDIFASFSLYFDKPFKVGDFIVIGDDKGTVQHIGIKSTRLKTLQGEELVVANKELTESRVQNYKKMKKRRINFKVGVTYDTSSAKLKKIPGMVKKIIDKEKLAEFDRAHFMEFADSSLVINIVYYIKTREYKDFADTQQSINFAIKEQFEKNKIDMAFPTRTIYMHKG